MRYKSISQLQLKNNNSFFKHLLLLSGNIEVNPGPVQFPPNAQKGMPKGQNMNGLDKFEMYYNRGLHFIHVGINSVLPKIEEIKYIARLVNLSIIGLSESKLDISVDDDNIKIPGFIILRKHRNRNGIGVLAYTKNDLSFNVRQNLMSSNEDIFFEMFLPHSKPILIGILYRPPNDSNFLKILQDTIENARRFASLYHGRYEHRY